MRIGADRAAGQPRRQRARPAALRLARFDDLGLRHAMSDRVVPLLVAAMAFLAALALSGMVGAATLAQRWAQGAEATVMVQVPQADGLAPGGAQTMRRDRVLSVLRSTPGIAAARVLSDDELADLLRPWLGPAAGGLALPLPAVIDVRLDGSGPEMTALAERLDLAAPGTLIESAGVWMERLGVLARTIQTCALVALTVVTAVAAAVIAASTRAGLAARRQAIEIVHGMGATDGYIARRFARRAMILAGGGGLLGGAAALPALLWLAMVAAPFGGGHAAWLDGTVVPSATWFAALPWVLWPVLPGLPVACAVIGWLTAQASVRFWLRQLP